MIKPIVITVTAKAQHGKDTFANLLKEVVEEREERILIIHYADILKYVCKQYFGWNGEKDEAGRSLLQFVGTELVRNNHPNAWVNMVIELVKGLQTEYDYVVIPDCRFPNEIQCWENTPFYMFTVKVIRKNEDGTDFKNNLTLEQQNHPSEIALDNYIFNYEVENINLEDLKLSAQVVLEDILKNVKEG